jgi:hypothetical protein
VRRIKINILSVIITLVFALTVVFAGNGYFVELINDFRGYDYGPKLASQYDWIGPKPGETINPRFLVNPDGLSLSEIHKNDLVLLTVVDPECAASKITREQMRFLDENLSGKGVDYFLFSFSPKISPSELSDYVTSLTLHTNSLDWSNGIETVLPNLRNIVTPSHILIDSSGTVIKSFPGTSVEKRIRDRMVSQLLKEVIEEKRNRSHTD